MQHKAIGGGTFEGQRVPDGKKLARVAKKFIYHSGTVDQLDNMKWGLEPQHGDWVREVASGSGLDEDELLGRSVPLVWMSDNPDWVAAKVSRKLGKHVTDVTREDIRDHGHLAMIPRKGDHAEHIWRVGDNGLDDGEYSPVTNLNGKTVKAYETDLYDYGEMGQREPFGVERNEYVSAQPVEPMFHLTGDDLLDFLDTVHDRSGKAQGGEVEDDGITAYHGSPHEFDQFDLSKIGTGEGAQAYGHGLYFAEAEPTAKIYRDTLSTKSDPLMDQYGIKPGGDVNRVKNLISQYGENIPNVDKIVNSERERWRDELSKIIDEKKVIDTHSNAYADETRRMLNYINDPARKRGHMYEVRINAHPDHFLDWDKPLSEQPHIMQAIDQHIGDPEIVLDRLFGHREATGRDLHERFGGEHKPKAVADRLSEMGIKGIKYFDAGSRGDAEEKPTRNYVVFDDKLVSVRRRYEQGGAVDAEHMATGGEAENPDIPQIDNAVSIFPKPQRMFPEDAPVAGGQYLNAATKEDMTGHKAAMASIGVQPGGKPYFRASPDSVDETGTPGRGSAITKTNLFKQKAGWKWAQAPEGHEATDTIVSVAHRGQHHYTLNAHFPKGVDLARYENSPTEPRLRPTTKGNVTLGPQVGSILVRGKEHPVYEHVIVKNMGGEVSGKKASGGHVATLRRMSDPAVNEAIRVINRSGSSPRDAVTLSKRLLGRQ